MEGSRPISLSLAATILILFAFANLAIPLMRGPGDANNSSVSGQILARGVARAGGEGALRRLSGSDQTQNSGQRQSSSSGFSAFGGNNNAGGPNILALMLLCLAMLFSGLTFIAAVGLLSTRLYGLIRAIIASAALLFSSIPTLLIYTQSGILTSLPWETIIEVFTGATTLILVLLPVSLGAFRKRKDAQENTDY
jgi:hypothetical protein